MSANTSIPPLTADLTLDPFPRTRDNLERQQAWWSAVDEAAARQHPYRVIPPASFARQRARIAGRDDADTDPHVAAADERWFGPDVEVVTVPTRSPELWLLNDH